MPPLCSKRSSSSESTTTLLMIESSKMIFMAAFRSVVVVVSPTTNRPPTAAMLAAKPIIGARPSAVTMPTAAIQIRFCEIIVVAPTFLWSPGSAGEVLARPLDPVLDGLPIRWPRPRRRGADAHRGDGGSGGSPLHLLSEHCARIMGSHRRGNLTPRGARRPDGRPDGRRLRCGGLAADAAVRLGRWRRRQRDAKRLERPETVQENRDLGRVQPIDPVLVDVLLEIADRVAEKEIRPLRVHRIRREVANRLPDLER